MALYKINLEIMPIQSVLDPQGEAIEVSLNNFDRIKASNFRVGKRIEFKVEAPNKEKCKEITNKLCKDLLVNEVIEKYTFTIKNEKK
jgi:phosphoribosylformylglycinamidine synthase